MWGTRVLSEIARYTAWSRKVVKIRRALGLRYSSLKPIVHPYSIFVAKVTPPTKLAQQLRNQPRLLLHTGIST